VFDEVMGRAVVLYQGFNGLKPDGVVRPITIGRMSLERCGNPDTVHKNDNLDGFAVHGSRWSTNDLRYCFDNPGNDLSAEDVRTAMSGALERWNLVSPLRFTEVAADAEADIHIGWHTADHGGGSPFDNGGAATAMCWRTASFLRPVADRSLATAISTSSRTDIDGIRAIYGN
jgi:matrix metalloproteinase-15 (membrane-inserted)